MNIELFLSLIQRQGTLEQVSTFLKERDLHSSGRSWKEMIGSRLLPAIREGRLSENDMIDLLRQTEEHGAQHIFLFKLLADRNIDALFSEALPKLLKDNGLPALGSLSLVDLPEKPTVVEVRLENDSRRSIYFKIVEKRSALEKVSDISKQGQLVITYNQIPYRAVNIMKISDDGTAEIRIQSYAEALSYAGHAEAVFGILSPVINRFDWRDEKLDAFKENLLDATKRTELQTIFGLRHTQHSNANGTRLSAAAGFPGASMYDDTEAVASVDRFMQKKDYAHCERVSVMMKRHGSMERSVGLLISGEANELAITSKVSKAEYSYIMGKILEHNK